MNQLPPILATTTPINCACPGCCPPRSLPCCDPLCPKCLGIGPAPLPFPDSGCQFGCNGKCPGYCPCDDCACCYTVRTTKLTTTSRGCVDVRRFTVTNTWTIVEYDNLTSTSTSFITLTVSDIFQYTNIVTVTSIASAISTTTLIATETTVTVSRVGLTTETVFTDEIITSPYLSFITTTPVVPLSTLGFFSTGILDLTIETLSVITELLSSSFGILTTTSTAVDFTTFVTDTVSPTVATVIETIGVGLTTTTVIESSSEFPIVSVTPSPTVTQSETEFSTVTTTDTETLLLTTDSGFSTNSVTLSFSSTTTVTLEITSSETITTTLIFDESSSESSFFTSISTATGTITSLSTFLSTTTATDTLTFNESSSESSFFTSISIETATVTLEDP
ncbi:hypothetical protein PSACC_02907 [Paramicrosporidium saccamoebae]|uniref:Uncharacterized protein n=1 Tax=Paramicrosporidium saccamoebae TaxID=1246581 RepID=A0A2H9THS7_9FUNG|nr:hypothetical protein PSACC_02907 [Paramicrosporidium saccamoebae]